MKYELTPFPNPVRGEISIPPDKSISHRALILSSIARGKSLIKNLLESQDTLSTLKILRHLGVNITRENNVWIVEGKGGEGFREPSDVLDAENSGTTARLLIGLLTSLPLFCVITGDNSLRKRPMDRVIKPLTLMGGDIWARENRFLPVAIRGKELQPITYTLPIPSAQVKSAIILAGLNTPGETVIEEPVPSRDHTERMIKYMGGSINRERKIIRVRKSKLKGREFVIPGDISSAAFFITLALLIPDSRIIMERVCLNPTRTGFLEILRDIGGRINILSQEENWEIWGDIEVRGSELKPFRIGREDIPSLIDEIPLLALLGTQIEGISEIRGAEELRVKESDRIHTTVENLRILGADIEELPDGMVIRGKTPLKGGKVYSFGDHRIAMMLAVAGCISREKTVIEGMECVKISYPSFLETLESVR